MLQYISTVSSLMGNWSLTMMLSLTSNWSLTMMICVVGIIDGDKKKYSPIKIVAEVSDNYYHLSRQKISLYNIYFLNNTFLSACSRFFSCLSCGFEDMGAQLWMCHQSPKKLYKFKLTLDPLLLSLIFSTHEIFSIM
jgi:hypothetical protein